MNIRKLSLFLLMNFNIIISKEKNTVDYKSLIKQKNDNIIKFTNKELQKSYEEKKDFYWKFLIEYSSIFKNPQLYDEKANEKIAFIKKFYKDNNLELTYEIFICIYDALSSINERNTYIEIDFENQIIQEFKYEKINKVLENSLNLLSINLSLLELINKKQVDFKECDNYMNILEDLIKEKKKKLSKMTRSIKFSELNLTNISIKNNMEMLKKNKNIIHYFNSFFYSIINYFKLQEKEIESMQEQIWVFINFFYDIYTNYFEYLISHQSNYQKEVEIISKIILLKKQNDFLKNFEYNEIYKFVLTIIYPLKINKEQNNIFYIYDIENADKYRKTKILKLDEYFLIRIVNCSLIIIITKLFKLLNSNDRQNINQIILNTFFFLVDPMLEIKSINI